jgi:hypothetical protein
MPVALIAAGRGPVRYRHLRRLPNSADLGRLQAFAWGEYGPATAGRHPFLLPVILLYTGWSYWVFRGKAWADIGYH